MLQMTGLSKAYRVCGYRAGWVLISGPQEVATDFIEGLTLIANMRMCSNVPAQHAIQTALGGYQSVEEFIGPGGRFYEQSMLADRLLNDIPGVSNVTPKGALYCFPRLDPAVYEIDDDLQDRYIPWAEFLEVLVRHGWQGYLSSEYEGDYAVGRTADQLRRQHALLRTLLQKQP